MDQKVFQVIELELQREKEISLKSFEWLYNTIRDLTEANNEIISEKDVQIKIVSLFKALLINKYNLRSLELMREILNYIIEIMLTKRDQGGNTLQLLLEIFSKGKPFYQSKLGGNSSLLERMQQVNVYPPQSPVYFKAPHVNQNLASETIVQLLNYFAINLGFDNIITKLNSENNERNSPISIHRILSLLEFTQMVRPMLDQSFAREYILKLQSSVHNRIINFTNEEFRELSKQLLSTSNDVIEYLLSTVISTEEASKISETFLLKLSLKSLNSNLLEKKLLGLQLLNQFIMSLSINQDNVNAHHDDQQRKTKWITGEYLLEWIENNQIVDNIFGDNTHIELIKRSSSLLKFLLERKRFSIAQLEVIWKLSLTQQDIIIQAIYRVLKDNIQLFQQDLLRPFMNLLSAVELREYTVEFVLFIETICERCLKEPDDDTLRVLPLKQFLWNCVQDSEINGSISEEVFIAALNSIKNIILKHQQDVRDFRPMLMNMIYSSLFGFSTSSQMWILFTQILEYYYQLVNTRLLGGISSIESYLQNLQLIDLLIDIDLPTYLKKANAISFQPSVKIGRFTHQNNLEIRLEFIYIILSKYSSMIQESHILTLWDQTISPYFLENQLTRIDDAEIALKWFTKSIKFLKLQTINDILRGKLMHIPSSLFTEAAFSCFEMYFRVLNSRLDRLTYIEMNSQNHESSPEISQILVKDFNLLGIEALWEIVLNTSISKPMLYLSDLYNQFGGLASNELFLKTLFNHLYEASVKISHTEETEMVVKTLRYIERCISLLTLHLSQLNMLAAAKEVVLHILGSNDTKQEISIAMNEPLNKLRDHIYSSVKKEANLKNNQQNNNSAQSDAALITSAQNIQIQIIDFPDLVEADYLLTIEQLGIPSGAVLMYQIISTPKYGESAIVPKPVSLHTITSTVAENKQHFFILFNLLDITVSLPPTIKLDEPTMQSLISNIKEKIWLLISKLPHNPIISRLFNSLTDVVDGKEVYRREDFLVFTSPYKLLYSLKVLQTVVVNTTSPNYDLWKNVFVQHRIGLKRIVELFYNNDIIINNNNNSSTREESARILHAFLMIFNTFVFSGSNHPFSSSMNDDALRQIFFEDNEDIPEIYEKRVLYQLFLKDSQFLYYVLDIIRNSAFATLSEPNQLHSEIVALSTKILLSITSTSSHSSVLSPILHEIKERILNYPALSELIMNTILSTSDPSIRSTFADFITSLFTSFTRDEVFSASIVVPLSDSSLSKLLTPQPGYPILIVMLELLEKIEANNKNTTQYYQTIGHILTTNANYLDENFVNHLLRSLVNQIFNHPIIEQDEYCDRDYVLIGKMELLSSLIENKVIKSSDVTVPLTSKLIIQVFTANLFELPTSIKDEAFPKCKTTYSRTASFRLLELLCSLDVLNYITLFELIETYHLSQPSPYKEYNYSPASNALAPCGYVGLVNLGCICYMNSLVQQLFMMPEFRKGILSLRLPKKINNDVSGSDNNNDNNNNINSGYQYLGLETSDLENLELINELQRMFGYLQESQKKYYNPLPFTKVNKDYDGKEYDVKVQMDVDEYFNLFSEKLENGLKRFSEENQNLLHDIWAGSLVTQFICSQCHSIKERTESYFTLSLDIKDNPDILAALNYYTKGEILERENAYFCDVCDKKVSAMMRRCIKSLPQTLIIHLKRFDFNFDTMKKEKINDHCSFPFSLNMLAYTKEGLSMTDNNLALNTTQTALTSSISNNNGAHLSSSHRGNISGDNNQNQYQPTGLSPVAYQSPDYYDYQLAGILVHRGGAESGHYYSYIKPRTTNIDAHSSSSSSPVWLEFNDQSVKEFDIKDIPAECFGGVDNIADHLSSSLLAEIGSDLSKQFLAPQMKSHSAYMLIYERSSQKQQTSSLTTSTTTTLNSRTASALTASWASLTIDQQRQSSASPPDGYSAPPLSSFFSSLFFSLTSLIWAKPSSSSSSDHQSLTQDSTLIGDQPSSSPSSSVSSSSLSLSSIQAALPVISNNSKFDIESDFKINSRIEDDDFIQSRKRGEVFNVSMPLDLHSAIWNENMTLNVTKHYDSAYFQFLFNIFKSLPLTPPSSPSSSHHNNDNNDVEVESCAIRVITKVLFEIIIHSNDVSHFSSLILLLQSKIASPSIVAEWIAELFEENINWIKKGIFECPNGVVRENFASFLHTLFASLYKVDNINYELSAVAIEKHPTSQRLLRHILTLLNDLQLPEFPNRLEAYFSLLLSICENPLNRGCEDVDVNGDSDNAEKIKCRVAINCCNLIPTMFDLFSKLKKSLSQSMIATDYGNALKFLKFLIQTPPSSVAWNSPPFTPQFQPPSVDLILTPDMMEIMGTSKDGKGAVDLLIFYSSNQKPNTEKIITAIMTNLRLVQFDYLANWQQIVTTYALSKYDNYQLYRIELVLSLLINLYEKCAQFPNFASAILGYIRVFYLKAYPSIPIVKNILDSKGLSRVFVQ